MFSQAVHNYEGDCSNGVNIPWEKQVPKNLADLGYSQTEIDELMQGWASGENDGERYEQDGALSVDELMAYRGRLNGQPVSALAYPATVTDPEINSLDGEIGYGFDLDGESSSTHAFTDPDTDQSGVDHALYRALGCTRIFRGTLDNLPTYWVYIWGQLAGSQPAWLITIAGDDLSRNGAVTVTFDRALRHVTPNADGTPRYDVTYRVDPDPRSHNVFRGKLNDGTVTLTEPGSKDFSTHMNPLLYAVLRLDNFHMRLKLKADRTLEGIIGGYQPWHDVYASFAVPGASAEPALFGDVPGLYYLMREYADADPHPKTGLNESISAAYYIEAVPAFAVSADTP